MFLAGGFARLGLNAAAAGDAQRASQYGAAAASMIFIFTFVFGATWLTVPWLYPAEIFPLAVRAKGNARGVVGWSIGNGWLVSYNRARGRLSFRLLTIHTIDTALPCHVFQHRRENVVYFWYQ